MNTDWLIYGANGYSARLALEKAVEQGHKPIVAGRNEQAIKELATNLGLEYRVFDLASVDEVVKQLKGVGVVSNCAGPFSATAGPMMKACIRAGAHYTDITGEIVIYQLAQQLHDEARQAGVVLCPGVGFDVIPTDCISNRLKQALPDATHLTLGFEGSMQMSPGTAKTTLEVLAGGIKILRQGELVTVPRTHMSREIDFGNGLRYATLIPWGDVITSYWQTDIPNISVYTPSKKSKLANALFPIIRLFLKIDMVRRFAAKRIDQRVTGPAEAERNNDVVHVWGEVVNAAGSRVTCRVKTCNGYDVTKNGILLSADYLSDYNSEGGCFTPSQLMGSDLVERLPGSSELVLS